MERVRRAYERHMEGNKDNMGEKKKDTPARVRNAPARKGETACWTGLVGPSPQGRVS